MRHLYFDNNVGMPKVEIPYKISSNPNRQFLLLIKYMNKFSTNPDPNLKTTLVHQFLLFG